MTIHQRIRGIATAVGIGAIAWLPFAALSGAAIVAIVFFRFGSAAGPPPLRYLLESAIATAGGFGAFAGGLWAVQVAMLERAFPSSPKFQLVRSALYGAIAGLLAPFVVPHATIFAHLGVDVLLAASALNGAAVGAILMATGHASKRVAVAAGRASRETLTMSSGRSLGVGFGDPASANEPARDAERVASGYGDVEG